MLEQLIERVKADKSARKVGSVSAQDIQEFEKTYDLKLPVDYATFLRQVGICEFFFLCDLLDVVDREGSVHTMDAVDHLMTDLEISSIAWLEEFLPFGMDAGNYVYCFDVSQISSGVAPVVRFDLKEDLENDPSISGEWDSFEKFVTYKYDQAIEDDITGPLFIASPIELPLIGDEQSDFSVRSLKHYRWPPAWNSLKTADMHVRFIGCHQKSVIHCHGEWPLLKHTATAAGSRAFEKPDEATNLSLKKLSEYLKTLVERNQQFILLADFHRIEQSSSVPTFTGSGGN